MIGKDASKVLVSAVVLELPAALLQATSLPFIVASAGEPMSDLLSGSAAAMAVAVRDRQVTPSP